ncbi:chaplin family protein [Dactylosporangium sp. NPDC000555]|uniref:chaplin family protein n=1 Tax=Dactylosporangium sp. NPDC000555 TaxID=3154260 RepID=UPI0033258915
MKRWLIRSVQVAALAMGGLALTGTAAHADSWNSGPNVGLFNGNQSSTTIQTPVNICGNSLAILGFASANCDGGAYAYNGSGSNGNGNANGYAANQKHKKYKKYNSAGANSRGNGGAMASNGNGGWTTGYNAGIGNGNQSSLTVQAPINVSCNSIALLGFASSC